MGQAAQKQDPDKGDANPISNAAFAQMLSGGFQQVLGPAKTIAVAVSGGPDSMALVHLLNDWAADKDIEIHALTVDHGLRPEASEEAIQVQAALPDIESAILKWEGEKPDSSIQEEARNARYALMAAYCRTHGIGHLFLAHHQNDQAETFLFRLAKGSGLDGLTAMMPVQNYDQNLLLIRPLLDIPKDRLIATCEDRGIQFVQDPSNESEDFARVRLRKSQGILEEEGLSAKRLSTTAKRLARARHALEEVSDMAFQDMAKIETDRIVLNLQILRAWPGEIGLRILLKTFDRLAPESAYGPRMEKAERLFEELMLSPDFRRQTLGGLIIARDDEKQDVILAKESS